jgi:RHS repeat-associated protein
LGSYCALTNADKQVRQRNWFDPWGNFTIDTANSKGISPPPDNPQMLVRPPLNFTLTNRGFTGHEHYPQFKIINMNGRLYDPVIGRFFSPDNFVQMPEFSQSYNRYSYALNNPLKYVDPSGETWYDVDGKRRYIDDGIDDMAIEVNRRQFNRLERKFENNRNYEQYRDKLANINGYTTTNTLFGNFKEMSQNGNGTRMLPGVEAVWHRPEGQSYSDWRNSNTLGKWSDGMPTDVVLNGQTYVVPYESDSYVNVNDINLRRQFADQLRSQGKYYKYHPLGMQLSGNTITFLHTWARLANPIPTWPTIVPMPDQSIKSNAEHKNNMLMLYYYRKENIIR